MNAKIEGLIDDYADAVVDDVYAEGPVANKKAMDKRIAARKVLTDEIEQQAAEIVRLQAQLKAFQIQIDHLYGLLECGS